MYSLFTKYSNFEVIWQKLQHDRQMERSNSDMIVINVQEEKSVTIETQYFEIF